MLSNLNSQFKSVSTAQPTTDVWKNLGFDKHLKPAFVQMKNKVGADLDEMYNDLIPYVNSTELPDFAIKKI